MTRFSPKNDRIIFLDIDGVLNLFRPLSKHERVSMEDEDFLRAQCTRLYWLVVETGAKLVLSSTWKDSKSNHEITRRIRAATPIHNSPSPLRFWGRTGRPLTNTPSRHGEIEEWLRAYDVSPHATNFVVLDDAWTNFPGTIRTDPYQGLTLDQALYAKKFLLNWKPEKTENV